MKGRGAKSIVYSSMVIMFTLHTYGVIVWTDSRAEEQRRVLKSREVPLARDEGWLGRRFGRRAKKWKEGMGRWVSIYLQCPLCCETEHSSCADARVFRLRRVSRAKRVVCHRMSVVDRQESRLTFGLASEHAAMMNWCWVCCFRCAVVVDEK